MNRKVLLAGSTLLAALSPPAFTQPVEDEVTVSAIKHEGKGFLLGYSAPPAALVIASKKSSFRQNMLDLANMSPELRQLAEEHDDLLKRYDQLLRRTVGASPKE